VTHRYLRQEIAGQNRRVGIGGIAEQEICRSNRGVWFSGGLAGLGRAGAAAATIDITRFKRVMEIDWMRRKT
jgi:hypothetical protein